MTVCMYFQVMRNAQSNSRISSLKRQILLLNVLASRLKFFRHLEIVEGIQILGHNSLLKMRYDIW